MAGKHRKNSDNSQERIEFPDMSKDAFEGALPDPPAIKQESPKIKKNKRKRRWIPYSIVGLLLVAGLAGFLAYWYLNPDAVLKKVSLLSGGIVKAPPKMTFCPLDGRIVKDPAAIKRRPLLVKVENLSDARPQSGLDRADIVYESMAEGGITRFAAFFLCQDADQIGPVRSARLQDIDFISEYDALFAHVGTSDAYANEASSSIADLDQFFHEDAYERVDWRDMPHNVYTSTKKLRDLAVTLGYEKEVVLTSLKFGTVKKQQAANAIDIPYLADCAVHYNFDAKSGTYLRSVAGQPHTDKVTGKQLSPVSVIVQYVDYTSSSSGEDYGMGDTQTMGLIGSGRALIFTGGGVIEGTWSRSGQTDRTVYTDAKGEPVRLNRGQIWIEFVPSSWDITYS